MIIKQILNCPILTAYLSYLALKWKDRFEITFDNGIIFALKILDSCKDLN